MDQAQAINFVVAFYIQKFLFDSATNFVLFYRFQQYQKKQSYLIVDFYQREIKIRK